MCGWNENRRVQAKSVNVVGDILQSITFPSHCHLLWLSILVTASRARAARTTRREASVETGTRRDKTAKNASPTTYRTTRPAPGCRRAPRRSAPPLTHSVVDARCCSACPIVLVSVALAVGRSGPHALRGRSLSGCRAGLVRAASARKSAVRAWPPAGSDARRRLRR